MYFRTGKEKPGRRATVVNKGNIIIKDTRDSLFAVHCSLLKLMEKDLDG